MGKQYSHLKSDEITKIIKYKKSGLNHREIAEKFNVSRSAISRTLKKYDNLLTNSNKYRHSNFKQLTKLERQEIEILYNSGHSYGQISSKIGRAKSTIYSEIKRNKRKNNNEYVAELAHKKATNRRAVNSAIFFEPFIKYFKFNAEFHQSVYHIITEYKKLYPKANIPCRQTVYKWFRKGIIYYPNNSRAIRKYTRKLNSFRDNNNLKSIHTRDFSPDNYDDFGNFEIDLIVGPHNTNGAILTLNERSTCKLFAQYVPNKKATSINKALRKLVEQIGPEKIKTITSDNGKEFLYSNVIEKSFNLNWYYADYYSSWQRGQNERLNRDLRLFFPKGFNLSKITTAQLERAVSKINALPRAKFEGLTAQEVYDLKYNAFNPN